MEEGGGGGRVSSLGVGNVNGNWVEGREGLRGC